MTVDVRVGDLFSTDVQTLVNTVNCVGVMGKGIALQFRERFPDMFRDYEERCARGEVRLGEPYLYKRLIAPWILNFPTKGHWRSVSRLSDIVKGLAFIQRHYRAWGIQSMAVPPLGCGEGGLEWRVVGPTLYRHLSALDIPVTLFAPWDTPSEELSRTFLADEKRLERRTSSKVNPAWIALAEVVRRVNAEAFHWPIGRTTFQKLAFFATSAGLPTGFTFRRGSYGPFSEDVKPALTKLVNNGVLVERKLGRMFSLSAGPTFEDARVAFLKDFKQWGAAIDKLTDLFVRISTSEAEIAATVLFAARELQNAHGTPTEMDVLSEVLKWKVRRNPPISESDAADAIRNLEMLSWVKLRPSLDLPVSSELLSLETA